MNLILDYFTSDFKHWRKVDFFKRLLYLFLFINTLTLLPAVNDIFGYNGLAGYRSFQWTGSEAFLNLLSHPINHNHGWIHWLFVIGQLVFLTTGFLRIYPKLSSLAIWFLTANLFTKGGLFFTGGEVLVNILLFYMIFIQKVEKDAKNYLIQNTLNNTFYILTLIQVCILYFFAFFWKLYDFNWMSGDAIYYISKIDTFSSNWFKNLITNNVILGKLLTYTVLFYQGSFIIFVWIKRLKIPFLILGMGIHIAISIGMGIFAFGIYMSISYILFLDNNQIEWLKKKLFFS